MNKKSLYRISRCGLFAAIICVCAFINIPVGAVPVSMALLAVMLSGIILSPFEATVSSVVYILIGAIGIPVFSVGGAGFGVLLGPTGGYLWSYPLLALIVSLFCLIPAKNKWIKYVFAFLGCVIGTALCYVCGTLQYMYVCETSFSAAVITCIFPFIPFDVLKIIFACVVGIPLKKRI